MSSRRSTAHSGAGRWSRCCASRGFLGEGERHDSPEDLLATTTYDGITISPLYTADDAAPAGGFPGIAPYVRGGTPGRFRHRRLGRAAAARRPRSGRDQPRGAGRSGERRRLGVAGARRRRRSHRRPRRRAQRRVPRPGRGRARRGRGVSRPPPRRTSRCSTCSRARRPATSASTRWACMPAPATRRISKRPWSWRCGPRGPIRSCGRDVVDALPYHDAGGSDAEELGCSLAAGVTYLRALTAAGLDVSAAAN
ncbi:methylmalonyl-CoA mutase family protein, partial [Kutzneria kofuensis]|uniref:methylmalonyl-CoA mutase family protein n=1 Tax=Kutzneria kofuensis TaxID=103725 RepID=UPI0031EA7B27